MRRFMLKRSPGLSSKVKWLNRTTVYEGKLISMTGRVVRLFAPDPLDVLRYVDVSYDWLVPVR